MTPVTSTTADGVVYRDLNGNGRMDPYEDPRLSPAARTEDLLSRLSVAEKAGLLFQEIMPPMRAEVLLSDDAAGSSEVQSITERFMNHFNALALGSPREAATWANALQTLAESTPHGIPITLSTDPRHGFLDHGGVSFSAGALSQWPEPLGLAALDSVERMREFADIARQEYLALGIRSALHPAIDLATEPRWARQAGTFGENSARTAELVIGYLDGFQGDTLGSTSVACMTKHFPGGGPQLDGEDPHFPYGREQVYPGGAFEAHLTPFRAAIARKSAALMAYYGMPVGLELDGEQVEEVGFGFNRRIIGELLRDELGYDGVVSTDWGLISDTEMFGKSLPARAWGVENLDLAGRMKKILDAGADQFGGEHCTELLIGLVADGLVPESRLDESACRVLLVKFQLGLFDNPYVDEDAAESIIGRADFVAAGHRAQAESVTVLRNGAVGSPVLPLAPGTRIYVEGVDVAVAAEYGSVVDDPSAADVAIIRLAAPFEPRDTLFLEASFHTGSLDFAGEVVEHIRALAQHVPVLIDVTLDRPAILTPFIDLADAIVADYGASDAAVLDALSGRIQPLGRLPFELPRSMAAIEASRSDVASDTAGPLFPYGWRTA